MKTGYVYLIIDENINHQGLIVECVGRSSYVLSAWVFTGYDQSGDTLTILYPSQVFELGKL